MAKLMSGQKADVPYTLRDMAADAAGLLDALGIAQAHIVGRSMGGAIAQLVAVDYPAKTRSLVSMMTGSARRGLPPPKPEAVMAMIARPVDDSREAHIAVRTKFFRTVQGSAYPASHDELRVYIERQLDRAPLDLAAAARQTAALIAAEPRNELLRSVRAPTLVLHGADDPLAPLAGARDAAECVPGAELVLVPGIVRARFPAACGGDGQGRLRRVGRIRFRRRRERCAPARRRHSPARRRRNRGASPARVASSCRVRRRAGAAASRRHG